MELQGVILVFAPRCRHRYLIVSGSSGNRSSVLSTLNRNAETTKVRVALCSLTAAHPKIRGVCVPMKPSA